MNPPFSFFAYHVISILIFQRHALLLKTKRGLNQTMCLLRYEKRKKRERKGTENFPNRPLLDKNRECYHAQVLEEARSRIAYVVVVFD